MLASCMRPGNLVTLVEGPIPFFADERFEGSVGDLEVGAELELVKPSPAFPEVPRWWIARTAAGAVTVVKAEILEPR